MQYNFVVPYRDRAQCLEQFLEQFPAYLQRQNDIDSYRLLIVEQANDRLFNLGCLINIGFDLLKQEIIPHFPHEPDGCFIWHPVDSLPIDTDYRFDGEPCLFFCDESYHQHYARFIGFTHVTFELVNGYGNTYWGWGVEDDDMLMRLKRHDIAVTRRFSSFTYTHPHGPTDTPHYNDNMTRLMANRNNDEYFRDGLQTLDYQLVETRHLYERIAHVLVDF